MSQHRRLQVLCGHVKNAEPSVGQSLVAEQTASTPALGRSLVGTYDYIVVGAGSAGCVVASRLSEDPKVSVLLIEAGGSNQRYDVRSPFLTCATLQNSDLDWRYRSKPQATTEGRVSNWPRGKCLGGSSSINYMIYCRGDPRNYDTWAQKYGCAGWSYKEVLPFFKKSENLVGEDKSGGAHGKGGPLQVSQMREANFLTKEICEKICESCVAAGVPANPDYNGFSQAGANLTQATTKNGVRSDTATAFLFGTGALERPNLTVMVNAQVTRLLLRGRQATGVLVERAAAAAEPPLAISCSKEVVLCCGAVGTPQLLMLSGIGPAGHLKEHGIDCVQDLPVGENLQDHLFFAMPYDVKPGKHPFAPARSWSGGFLAEYARYLLFGQGSMSFTSVQAVAFDHTHLPGSDESEGNDLQLHMLGISFTTPPEVIEANFGLKKEDHPPLDAEKNSDYGVGFMPTLLLPKSKGTIRLASADPNEYPIIDPNYFADPRDMDVCVAGMKLVRKIASSPPLSEILEPAPGNDTIKHPFDSEEYMREYVRKEAVTVYHPAGTAKMGPDSDAKAVVDLKLRVRGITGLRVADASIMPDVISGNTNAPSIMIGERAAAFIQGS